MRRMVRAYGPGLAQRPAELANIHPGRDSRAELISANLAPAKLKRITLAVNRQARNWLQKTAVEKLNESIRAHGRPQGYMNSRRVLPGQAKVEGLRSTIMRAGSHEVTDHSVRFMVDDLVRERAPHYRVIELGWNEGFVGSDAPILFKRAGQIVRPQPGIHSDATLRDTKGLVRIKNAIRPYHYLRDARQAFEDQNIYLGYLDEAAQTLRDSTPGVDIIVSRR